MSDSSLNGNQPAYNLSEPSNLDDGLWSDETSFAEEPGYEDFMAADDFANADETDDSFENEQAFQEEDSESWEEYQEDMPDEEERQFDDKDKAEEDRPEDADKSDERERHERDRFDADQKNFRDEDKMPKLPDFRLGRDIEDPAWRGRDAVQPNPAQPSERSHVTDNQYARGLQSDDPADQLKAYQHAMGIPDARIASFMKAPNWQEQVESAASKLAEYSAAFQNAFGLSNARMDQLSQQPGWGKFIDNQFSQMSKALTELNHISNNPVPPDQQIMDRSAPWGWYREVPQNVASYHEMLGTYQQAFGKTDAEMAALTKEKGWGTQMYFEVQPVMTEINRYALSHGDIWRIQIDQYIETHKGWALDVPKSLAQFETEKAAGAYPTHEYNPDAPPKPAVEIHYTAPELTGGGHAEVAPPVEQPVHHQAEVPHVVEVPHEAAPPVTEPEPMHSTVQAGPEIPSTGPVHAAIHVEPETIHVGPVHVDVPSVHNVNEMARIEPVHVDVPPVMVAVTEPVHTVVEPVPIHLNPVRANIHVEPEISTAPPPAELPHENIVQYEYDSVQGQMTAVVEPVHVQADDIPTVITQIPHEVEIHNPLEIGGGHIQIDPIHLEPFHFDPEVYQHQAVVEPQVYENQTVESAPEHEPDPEAQRMHHWGGKHGWDGGSGGWQDSG